MYYSGSISFICLLYLSLGLTLFTRQTGKFFILCFISSRCFKSTSTKKPMSESSGIFNKSSNLTFLSNFISLNGNA